MRFGEKRVNMAKRASFQAASKRRVEAKDFEVVAPFAKKTAERISG